MHYDTVFNVEDYYVSTLTFRHLLFSNEPIIPCGFLIHSHKYQSDHRDFLSAVALNISRLLTKRVNIVTDREFKFEEIFPVGKQLYCWNHLEHDLQWYLRSSNCSPSDVAYVVSEFKSLMNVESETEFDDRWDDMKKNGKFAAKKKICNYFDTNLLPYLKSNAAIWTL